jgi:hypothetical protein
VVAGSALLVARHPTTRPRQVSGRIAEIVAHEVHR